MEIVLLQDVKSLGKKGQVVKVNDGYARNYILPKKLGVEANAKSSWLLPESWQQSFRRPLLPYRLKPEREEEPSVPFLPKKSERP